MQQDDINRLTKRIDNILREILPPGTEYKSILIVAEREEDGIRMALGTNASYAIAADLTEMAMRQFTEQAEKEVAENLDLGDIAELIHRFADLLERKKKEPPAADAPADPAATKH